jgi:hypothetical protein
MRQIKIISNYQFLISNERPFDAAQGRRHLEIQTLDILLEIRNWILEIFSILSPHVI